jgi:hypothetical protein
MAEIRGTVGHQPGGQTRVEPTSRDIPADDLSSLGAIREHRSRIDIHLDTHGGPAVNRYLPVIGRVLIVVKFLAGAMRLVAQWSNQALYLHDFRKFPNGLNHVFLVINVVPMAVCASLIIIRKCTKQAVAGLIGVLVVQALGYGLLFDSHFLLQSLSAVGGLLMVLADSQARNTTVFTELPTTNEKYRMGQVDDASREGSFEQALS